MSVGGQSNNQRHAVVQRLHCYPHCSSDSFLLQEAVQAGEAEGIVRALKEVKLADLRAEVAEAALTNELRSGERGKTAQNRLLSLEARYTSFGMTAEIFLLDFAGGDEPPADPREFLASQKASEHK